LDRFCDEIRTEIDKILIQSPARAQDWIFSEKNTPFSPKSLQIAVQLMARTPTELQNIIRRFECGPKSSSATVVV
jgi:hypothetical protein